LRIVKIGCNELVEAKHIIYKSIFTEAKELKEALKQVREQLSNLSIRRIDEAFRYVYRLVRLLEDYNSLRFRLLSLDDLSNLYSHVPDISTNFLYIQTSRGPEPKLILSPKELDMALYEVVRAERGCSIIISVCEDLIKPNIPPASIDRLNQLMAEIEKIEKDLPAEEIYLADNLKKAIVEYEQGHFLASALIASRIIVYVYENIPSEDAQKDRFEQKLQTLIKKGVIDKDRKDEQKLFLRAAVHARNYLSHDIKISPEVEDALSLISSAVSFCKYFITLRKIG
jgi:hypothetical protein